MTYRGGFNIQHVSRRSTDSYMGGYAGQPGIAQGKSFLENQPSSLVNKVIAMLVTAATDGIGESLFRVLRKAT